MHKAGYDRVDALKLGVYRRNPVLFVERELGGTPSPDQKKILMDCADLKNLYFILSAGRGAGKTRVVAWIVCWSMACLPDIFGSYEITILGGSYDQSRIMYRYFNEDIYKTKYLEGRLTKDPTKGETDFEGGYVRALTASERAVRGPHPELLIMDEVCAADDEIVSSALPMIGGSKHGRIIMLSTPHKFFGIFQDYWENYKLYEYMKYGPWPLTNCSWISQKWVKLMRKQYTPEKFKVEILGEFPEAGSLAFNPDWIDACTANAPFGINPNYNHDAGIDWGHVNPSVLVKAQLIQGKVRYPGPTLAWQYELYPKIQEEIKEEYHTKRGDTYYADASHIGENQRLEANGINVEPILFTTKNKPALAELMSHMLYKGLVEISPDNEELILQMKKYRWEETKTGKEKLTKKNVDYIEAMLLSIYSLYEEGYLSDLTQLEDKFLTFN